MIRSMTAFAACERAATGGQLACELRSVNHRFHELSVRAPEELRAIEPALRERVAQKVSRGKVDLVLRFRPVAGSRGELRLNQALLDQLAEAAQGAQGRFPGLRTEFTELLRYPGVVEEEALDQAGLQADALALLDETLAEFVAAREREGAKLAAVMRERIDGIERITGQVRDWLPEIRAALRAKLDGKLADLKLPLDPGRLEQEVVLNLQKIDVDEELDRLASHVAEARRVLGLPEAVGRRLDFLMQEFNREANTLGSKSVDSRTTQAAVELKVLIEQLREQVQNLE
ncbi:MAG: YicC/YloC family endoribonuclease [Pseudomonadota bacterium]